MRRTLDQLSSGATSAEYASRRCQQTLEDVKKLLDPESITQYKFKAPKKSSLLNTSASQPRHQAPNLSPFARMVFDQSEISYRYLTPVSPEAKTKSAINVAITNGDIGEQTPQFHVKEFQAANGLLTPGQEQLPNGSQASSVRAVVVPDRITPAQRAEYQVMSEADSLAGAQHLGPTPTKQRSDLVNGNRYVSVDQRQKGDATVQSLQSLLAEVFIAEDQLQSEFSHRVFSMHLSDGHAKPTLQHEVQSKLDILVQKVIQHGRIENIELDHLAHTQRLCESAMTAAEELDLQVGEDWSVDDVDKWTACLPIAERALVAARTLMRIMSAGSHLKELQSEDFLRVILDVMRKIVETCIVPTVEERALQWERTRGGKDAPPANPKFSIAHDHSESLQALLTAARHCLRVLGDFLTKSELDESALSGVEYLCKALIFADNASNEKDSIFGIQNFETIRRCAMDVLARMFAHYPDQRQFILDEVLVSLEKLPATKQSARQYRLTDGKPIQLVSALLMRLVQTTATSSPDSALRRKKLKLREEEEDDDEDNDNDNESLEDGEDEDDEIRVASSKSRTQPDDLITIAKPLHDATQANASYIIKVLLGRALNTSKSSEEPYRRLLDIFTDDFLNVLGHPDWPSSELLLRMLMSQMINLVNNPKSAVPSRTLALELLGTIGAGIQDLRKQTIKAPASTEPDNAALSQRLTSLVRQLEIGEVELSSLVAFDGPYRIVMEYLQPRSDDDAQVRSARGFHLMQWAFYICGGREGSIESDSSDAPRSSKDMQRKLRNMMLDSQWLEEAQSYPDITPAHARQASRIIALSSNSGKAFGRIFSILLSSLSSDHPTMKSRGLKSVVMLLEKDPSILDRNTYVLANIFRCLTDASSLVRDSTLLLLNTCRTLRPTLDPKIYERIIERTKDAAIGVRKRAIKMLKDVYLHNDHYKMRSNIAQAIISRIHDNEESVAELSRQTIEEIWFAPFYSVKLSGDNTIEAKLRYNAHAALLIQTAELGDDSLKVLESLLKDLLTRSKTASSNKTVCQVLISVLSDGVIDSADIPGSPGQSTILRTLTIFAKAAPTLFTAAQLERLEPYTRNLNIAEDLEVYRPTTTLLRHALPHQPMLKKEFLQTLQTAFLSNVSKLVKAELVEVVPCLWTIDGMLSNTERLVNFVISALTNVYKLCKSDLTSNEQLIPRLSKLVVIVGQFGKACDFNNHLSTFKDKFPWYKGDSVAGLMVEVLSPLTSPKRPLALRQTSLEAICAIAQAWPHMLLRPDVTNAFETVFKDLIPSLEEVLLTGLQGFFCPEDMMNGAEAVSELGSGVAAGADRLESTYRGTHQDTASNSIAQRFLPQFLRLALSSCDELAFVATKIVVSVNSQGIVHPKESVPALIALETCPNRAIANIAFAEHRAQQSKHETLFDKEYMRAVQQAFKYQKNVFGDTSGATGRPPIAKMHLLWENLKMGKAQIRKKFLNNLPQKLDFKLNDLHLTGTTPEHLLFVRFCSENLALFDYNRVDDLNQVLSALEKAYAGTGTNVAQAIESDVLQLQVGQPGFANGDILTTSETMVSEPATAQADPDRLRQLAAAAQICSIIFETRTMLRRLWNMRKYASKTKGNVKEVNKAPTKATNAPFLIDAYLQKTKTIIAGAADPHAQHETCSSFVELMSVDSEVKVGTDDDDEEGDLVENGYDTPSEGTSGKSPSLPPSGGGRGRKRKSAGAAAGTPRKRGRPSVGSRKSGSAALVGMEDEYEG